MFNELIKKKNTFLMGYSRTIGLGMVLFYTIPTQSHMVGQTTLHSGEARNFPKAGHGK